MNNPANDLFDVQTGDVSRLIDQLNDKQREAVTAPPEHRLVLAGAGSGKTRVLVHRLAWLIEVERNAPYSILAVTFTNKAAGEMRSRAEQLLGTPAGGMWIGTFHGLAHRLLRLHYEEARLPQSFNILDADDQYRLLRRVMRGMELDESRWPPKQVQWWINGQKDEGLRPQHIPDHNDPIQREYVRIYSAYEAACERAGVVDFAELLLRAHELIRDNPELLQHYRSRFRHLLIDEFQDTNTLQYAWIRLLAGDAGRVFVVGDDDQSVYGWRGAKVENIQQFSKDYPGAVMVRLEQNYRSTSCILNAANAVIANNTSRLGKNLWTESGEGERIGLFAAWNEQDEAQFVIQRISEWVAGGGLRREVAILYRSNAQSRVFEEQLIAQGMPYRVYGGLRFFERQEIKDAMAYLRLLSNRNDDPSFERVVNTPTRAIGGQTVEQIRRHARALESTMWEAAADLIERNEFTARAGNAVKGFLRLIEQLDNDTAGTDLHEQIEHIILHSGLIEHYKKEKGEKGEARIENLEELVSAGRAWVQQVDEIEEGMTPLAAFLSHAALESGEAQGDEWEDCVQLMSLHSAKGLEFPLVFLCGLEEGLFPHQRSIQDPSGLEEERRLAYVGITRAMQKLYMSYAERRRLYGQERDGIPSRFIRETPEEYLEEIRPRVQISRPVYKPTTDRQFKQQAVEETGFSLGQRVSHGKFGDGVILNFEGDGAGARVQVNFQGKGSKWLVLKYANLQAA